MTQSNWDALFLSTVERVERLHEERQGINDDIKDVKAEFKSQGGDPRMVDYAVKMRRMEREAREELLMAQERALRSLGLA